MENNLITHFVKLGHFKIKSIAGSKNDSYVVVIIILWYQGLSEGSNIKADFLTKEERLAMCQWKKSTINASIFTPKKIALFLNYCCEVVKRDFGRQLIKPVIDHFHHGGCKRGFPPELDLSKEFVVQNFERFRNGPQHTSDAIQQKFIIVENICLL